MSLTKYLCKWFDKGNKGYVTIGDIDDKIITFIINSIITLAIVMMIAFIILAIFIMVGDVFYLFGGYIKATDDIFTIKNFIIGLIIVVISCSIIYILNKIWEKIKEFKVVKCPLKEKK